MMPLPISYRFPTTSALPAPRQRSPSSFPTPTQSSYMTDDDGRGAVRSPLTSPPNRFVHYHAAPSSRDTLLARIDTLEEKVEQLQKKMEYNEEEYHKSIVGEVARKNWAYFARDKAEEHAQYWSKMYRDGQSILGTANRYGEEWRHRAKSLQTALSAECRAKVPLRAKLRSAELSRDLAVKGRDATRKVLNETKQKLLDSEQEKNALCQRVHELESSMTHSTSVMDQRLALLKRVRDALAQNQVASARKMLASIPHSSS